MTYCCIDWLLASRTPLLTLDRKVLFMGCVIQLQASSDCHMAAHQKSDCQGIVLTICGTASFQNAISDLQVQIVSASSDCHVLAHKEMTVEVMSLLSLARPPSTMPPPTSRNTLFLHWHRTLPPSASAQWHQVTNLIGPATHQVW